MKNDGGIGTRAKIGIGGILADVFAGILGEEGLVGVIFQDGQGTKEKENVLIILEEGGRKEPICEVVDDVW